MIAVQPLITRSAPTLSFPLHQSICCCVSAAAGPASTNATQAAPSQGHRANLVFTGEPQIHLQFHRTMTADKKGGSMLVNRTSFRATKMGRCHLMISRLRGVSGTSIAAFALWKTIHGLRVRSTRRRLDTKAFVYAAVSSRFGLRTLFRHGKHSTNFKDCRAQSTHPFGTTARVVERFASVDRWEPNSYRWGSNLSELGEPFGNLFRSQEWPAPHSEKSFVIACNDGDCAFASL
jgi:hypothetical protein